MSFLLDRCLQVSPDLTLPLSGQDLVSRGSPISMYGRLGTARATSPVPANTASMCATCEDTTLSQLTLFAEDHPVSRSAMPGTNEARQMTATSGRKCIASFESLTRNPAPLFLRMCLESAIWFSEKYLLTWSPRATANNSAFEFHLRLSELPTSGIEYSSWPTPRSQERQQQNSADSGMALSKAFRQEPWPTPQTRDFRHGSSPDSDRMQRKAAQGWSENLNDAVLPWATPTASAAKGSGPYGSKSHQHDTLKGNLKAQVIMADSSGQLNPGWELQLMGFPPGWLNLTGPPGEDSPSTTGNSPAPSPETP